MDSYSLFEYKGRSYEMINDRFYCDELEVDQSDYSFIYNNYLFEYIPTNEDKLFNIYLNDPWNTNFGNDKIKSSIYKIIKKTLSKNDRLNGYVMRHKSGKYGSRTHIANTIEEVVVYRYKKSAYMDRYYRNDEYYVVPVIVSINGIKEIK